MNRSSSRWPRCAGVSKSRDEIEQVESAEQIAHASLRRTLLVTNDGRLVEAENPAMLIERVAHSERNYAACGIPAREHTGSAQVHLQTPPARWRYSFPREEGEISRYSNLCQICARALLIWPFWRIL